MTKIRVAVVGAGHLGKIHTRLLKSFDQVELVAVAEPSPLAQQQLLDVIETNVVSDYRKLFGEIDAAVVATPTRTHFEIASNLLKAGIHTLIEKPITDSVSDAQELCQIAEQNKCVIQVGHCERFNPAIKAALELVGQPKFIQASRMSGYTFRSTDIGVVHDLMIHDIDLVNSVFPGKHTDTAAVGMSIFGHNEDVSQARIEFSCGGVANLTASRCSFNADRTFQIFGTDGFANVNLSESRVTFVKIPQWVRQRKYDILDTTPEQQAFIRDNLFTKILPQSEIDVPTSNAILAEHEDWIDAIATGSKPRVSAEQGTEAVEIAKSIIDAIDAHPWSSETPESIGPMSLFADPSSAVTLPFSDPVDSSSERRESRKAA